MQQGGEVVVRKRVNGWVVRITPDVTERRALPKDVLGVVGRLEAVWAPGVVC